MKQIRKDTLFGHVLAVSQLGILLKQCRKNQNLTIKGICNTFLIGNRFISEIENGKESARLNRTLNYGEKILGLNFYIGFKNIPYDKKLTQIHHSTDLKTILKKRRKEQSLTLQDMFGLSDLSLRFYSNLENGHDCQLNNFIKALKEYSLELVVLPRNMYAGELYE